MIEYLTNISILLRHYCPFDKGFVTLIHQQNMTIDLHSHSTASDGELTPGELVRAAGQVGIQVLALTDHDTVKGVPEALSAAEQENMTLIPGVELSSRWRQSDVHVVGLDVDITCREFLGNLDSQMERRGNRARAIGNKLNRLGFPDVYEAAVLLSPYGIPARPHFAQALVDQEICQDRKQAFSRYLRASKPAYVKTEWPDISESVQWIHQAGGKAVLAHAGRYKLTRTKLNQLIKAFAEAGGDAIEVSVATHTPEMVQQLADLANKYQLYASQGSDYHGPSTRWVKLGKMPALPSRCQLLASGFRVSDGSAV